MGGSRRPEESARRLSEQCRYVIAETEKFLETRANELNLETEYVGGSSQRHFWFSFIPCSSRGLILDGWPGWCYVFQRTLAEIFFSLRVIEVRLTHPKRGII